VATRHPANDIANESGAESGSQPRVEDQLGGSDPRFASDTAAGQAPINRRKSKKAADAERRERHRMAGARLEAERAARRASNRAARERDAAERAARQGAMEAAQDHARRQEEERLRYEAIARRSPTAEAGVPRGQPAAANTAGGVAAEIARQRAEEQRQADAAKAAARERKRRAEAERRAARAERARQEAERKAEQRRARDEERRAEREASHARAPGADPYAILGVSPDATADEVARAYRRLARTLHPDLNREGTAQERAACEAQMKRVNVAYGLVGDPQRRSAYDRQRRRR